MVPGLEQFLQSVIKDIYSYQKKDTWIQIIVSRYVHEPQTTAIIFMPYFKDFHKFIWSFF